MSNRTDFENQAREHHRRHHMTDEPHPHDVKALERELHNAYVAGQEAEDVTLRATIDRLREERSHRVAGTVLGKLSEDLEADNMATEAKMVRSAMHTIEDLREALSFAASVVGPIPINAMTRAPTVAQMQALQAALRKAGAL